MSNLFYYFNAREMNGTRSVVPKKKKEAPISISFSFLLGSVVHFSKIATILFSMASFKNPGEACNLVVALNLFFLLRGASTVWSL